MKIKTKLLGLIRLLFPASIIECGLLFFLMLFFGLIGTKIAMDYRIVFDDRIPWDAYFSFDNRSIIMTGGGFERHPLSNYFFDGLRSMSLWFSHGKKDAYFRLFYVGCSVVAISLALLQIFKYLKNIVQLHWAICLLLVLMTASFSTSILLSFTPETYTYTFLLLCVFNYYAALKIKKEQEIPLSALSLAAIGIGGLTITNVVKVFIPLLYGKNLFWNAKKIGTVFLKGITSASIFVFLFLYRLQFDYQKIFTKTGEQYEKFSQPKVTPLWDMVVSWFLGGNVLFPTFIIREYHSKAGFQYKALFMDVYSSPFSYIFVAILLGIVLWSVIKNFKNKYVQILVLSFFVDLFIHVVLKFGLHTSYIYGGHFVFVYPLLWGWLLKSYQEKPLQKGLLGVTLLFTMYLVLNNIYRFSEFFDFVNLYYR